MKEQRARLTLTALSPLHIGCGQDYAPYEYLDDTAETVAVFGVEQLQSVIPLMELHGLSKAASDPGDPVRSIKKFIGQYKDELLAQPGLRRIPKLATRLPDRTHIKRLERTAFDPFTDAALLPGSSIKGALRTAWLAAHPGLLRVGIPEDPLRLLSIGDAPASNEARALMFLQRVHKKPLHDRPGSPSSVRYDYLLEAIQRRGKFQTEIILRQPERGATLREPIPQLSDLMLAANRHYMTELDQCLAYLADMANDYGYGKDWSAWIDKNIRQKTGKAKDPKTGDIREVTTFGGMLAEGRGFLLRVGKHGGAESLTLDGLRQIRTKYGTKPTTFTMTLTANDTEKPTASEPFGWVFVQLK
ncbi:MAG: RAMP superfamily CRISPR-associated protein [Rhodocyclaceae bacterium]|nr:RAMP superfamily CRISPR-associated protein [Rhodocyclaceae bacterium]